MVQGTAIIKGRIAMGKINKKEILQAFQSDYKEAERHQREWFIRREEYLSESTGQPYGNEEDGKSKIISKDIAKQINWMLPSLADPFLSSSNVIKCNPITFEDAPSARQNELLLNAQFCRKFPRYNFIMKALRVLVTEGTVVIQTGWDYKDEEVEIEAETVSIDPVTGEEFIELVETTETRVLINQPTAVVCRNEDIFIDPTCMDDMEKCQFVIHKYETNLAALREDGRYKNLDKVAKEQHTLAEDPTYIREDQSYFEFKDEPRRKFIIYEYWGSYDIDGDGKLEDVICAWVGNTIVRLEANPYPDKRPPFVVVPFNAVPFQLFGEALAENIGDNQKVKTAITRGIIDNMAQSNNGQVGMRRGALDMNNRRKFLKGKNFEFNGTPGDFWEGSYNNIPSSAFDMLSIMNNEIESQTGVKSFSGGINAGSLGATAAGARGALDATSTRRLNLVRNVAENMIKPMIRKWMAYNAEFLEDEEVVRVTNEEFVPVRKDDLAGNLDIDITISTAEDNAAKAQELSFMMQTMAQSMQPDISLELLADWADLTKMPEEAKKLRERAEQTRAQMNQPDPVQEQMKQIELQRLMLENKKLEADIADKLARAGENEVDKLLKMNKAKVEEAKARKLGTDADLGDLKFLKDNEGVDRQESNEMEYAKMQHQYNLAELQINAGDKNIGMAR